MTFTKAFMLDNRGCYSIQDLSNCSFMRKNEIILTDILDSEILLKDKYWFVCRKIATKEQNQHIAIGMAELALPVFENICPEDKRPRKAIDAAKKYLSGSINHEDLLIARRDATAAAGSAVGTPYYAAAASAAYAAGTTYAPTYAATAAYYAIDAAGDTLALSMLKFLKEFCEKSIKQP